MTGSKLMRRREGDELIDPRFVKAISHPLRVEIVAECSLAPTSEAEFRARRGSRYTRQAISHHFAVLVECEAIEEVDSRRERGGLARYYAATARALFSEDDFGRFPPALQGNLSAAVVATFVERTQESLLAGTVDSHPERHLTWSPLKLDSAGFLELVGKLNEIFYGLEDMEEEAKERMDRSGEEPMHTTVALFGFESPPPNRDHQIDS